MQSPHEYSCGLTGLFLPALRFFVDFAFQVHHVGNVILVHHGDGADVRKHARLIPDPDACSQQLKIVVVDIMLRVVYVAFWLRAACRRAGLTKDMVGVDRVPLSVLDNVGFSAFWTASPSIP